MRDDGQIGGGLAAQWVPLVAVLVDLVRIALPCGVDSLGASVRLR